MKWILPAVVAIVSSMGTAVADSSDSEVMRSYTRARAVLDAGVAAMGGAEALTSLTSVTREFENHRTNPGQGLRPFDGAPTIDKYPIFSLTPTTSVIDYAGERFYFGQQLLSTSKKEWVTTIDAGGPAGGFSTVAYRDEAPVYTANPAAVSRDFITRELRTYPEAILRAALRRPATLQWFGDTAIGGRRAQIISFVDYRSLRIRAKYMRGEDTRHRLR